MTLKAPSHHKVPDDLPKAAIYITKTMDIATKGGEKRLIKIIDKIITDLKEKIPASIILKIKKLLGTGPKLAIKNPSDKVNYLKPIKKEDLKHYKAFSPIPTETRRTGGVLEARALEHTDGSVTFELAGTIKESISDLRRSRAELAEKYDLAADFNHKSLDYSKSLDAGSLKFYNGINLKDYDRAHLWGPGFGDEAKAGIMYAPKEFNRIWQNLGIEDAIRDSAKTIEASGGKLILRAKARSYPPEKDLFLKGKLRPKDQEFLLKELVYEIEVHKADGSVFTGSIQFNIPLPGKNFTTNEIEFFGADLLMLGEKLGK